MTTIKKAQQAASRFCDGHSCAQAVLTSYSERYGLDVEQAMKLTTGLAGGMGRMANTCGAVTGSILVIGLGKSSGKAGDYESKEVTFNTVQDFSKVFESKHGSLICKELLDCDISQAEGYKQAREKELFKKRCPHFVETAVAILETSLDSG